MILQAPKVKKSFIHKVEEIVGPGGLSLKNLDRFNYSRDSNFKGVIQNKFNKVEYLPDLIVWPENTMQVQKLVKLAGSHRFPIVPFGGGSGVCGGTVPVQGGMVVDVKKMNHLIRIDPANLLVEVEAGIMGLHLEKELERNGFTLGHFPSSILCASLGGYLAARSAGQKSSRYGKIEDMVKGLECVTGKGEVLTTRDISHTGGIDLNQLWIGSEGVLGIFTKATLRIYPKPERLLFNGFKFRNMDTAFEAARRLIQSGIRPAVVRLYDKLDTFLFLSSKKSGALSQEATLVKSLKDSVKFASLKAALMIPQTSRTLINYLPTGCLLILMFEGHQRIVTEERRIGLEILLGAGGIDLGDEPGRQWYEHRYSISYNASPIFHEGLFTDTIEVATTWDNILMLYKKMLRALSPHALVMAHLSHVYTDGGSLYFTFVAPLHGLKKSEDLYDLIWDQAMQTCLKVGGTISHHHGIGRLKAKYMEKEWGAGVQLLRAFKKFYDPHQIMNPGKLLDAAKA